MSERLRSIELDPKLSRAFAETFISRWDGYPLQQENGSYVQVREKLTLTHIFQHLTNPHIGYKPMTIGAYALDSRSQAKWTCFHANTPEPWSQLRSLAQILMQMNVTTYLEPSAAGGHLWLFMPTLPGSEIRQFARKLLASNQIPEYSINQKHRIEIYPKQDFLGKNMGSFVRLPLGFDQKSGQIHTFIDLEGKSLAPSIREQMGVLAQAVRVPHAFITAVQEQQLQLPSPPPKPSPAFKKRKPQRNESLSESLKHLISVFEFIGRYVDLNEQGRGICPFHHDLGTSFAVNKERNYWHCFSGCGGGSIIDFWVKWRESHDRDSSFIETIKELRAMLF